jgi:8-amino-3,8-dideoxy-alpha-D-manno-octulosonate transaminase
MSAVKESLALYGGTPALRRPLNFGKGVTEIGDAEKSAAVEVLTSGVLLRHRGTHVPAFEQEFSEFIGAPYVLACSSGTAGLRLMLAALGVGPGDEVVIPAVTFIACAGAVAAQGARPVFCDVDDLMTMDAASLSTCITARTKAVMPVHLFGMACDMDAIRRVCLNARVAVIEDAAQACGARYDNRKLGALGTMGAFSFQQGKMITCGEGGAVVTADENLYQRAVQYHDHGNQFPILHGATWRPICGPSMLGENLRMGELAAAILRCQLKRLPSLVENTNRVRLAIERGLQGLTVPFTQGARTADATGIGLQLPTADIAVEFTRALQAEGVPAARLYDGVPVYAVEQVMRQQTANTSCAFGCAAAGAQARSDYHMGMCPKAEDLVARTVGVAVGPRYSEQDVADVVSAIEKVTIALRV